MKKYLAIFRKRWFWQALGLLVLGLVIWFVGPLISIGAFTPLAGLWTRIVIILLLIAALAGTWLWKRWRAKRAARALEEGLTANSRIGGATEEVEILQDRFAQAMELLKKSRKGKRDLSERWLYELPWYLIIGPPGSGKTTLLANSDLEFPLEGEFGKNPVAGVGGTRNCDWSFTNDAILLDTAGRYTTQDSHQQADAEAWLGFLDLLKKHRPRRPINGVLVAVSLQDLMYQSEAERRDQAAAIRQRISELHERLKVRFPVYLLITKCDLLAGFVEFFEDMGRDERAQVWGYTFKLADAREGVDVTERALEELDLLVNRLNDQVCQRMNAERSLSRRTRIFGFPQQMSSLRGTIADFIRQAFKPNRFQEPPLLRGVYFTSGTQEGTPVDRLLRELADSYGLDRASPVAAVGGAGRSYFINRVFSRIVFPEANLVGTDPKAERRRRWLRRAAFASIGLVSLVVVLGWMWSFRENQAAIVEVRAGTSSYIDAIADVPMNGTDFAALVRPLNELEAASEKFPRSPPLSMGLGLYQGPKVDPGVDDAYHRALATRLLASVGERLRELLRQPDAEPAQLARRLKAYLMLGYPERVEPEHVRAVMTADWAGQYLNDPQRVQDLDRHLAHMLDEGYAPLPMDKGLIQDARNRLAQVPAWQIIYNLIKETAAADHRYDYQLVDLLGRDGDLVFTSTLGSLDTVAVPGLYTLKGWQNIFSPESRRLIRQVGADAWVYGIEEDAKQFQADLAEELANRYASDYIDAWRSVLDSLSIRPARNLNGLVDQVELAAGPASPLREVIEEVSKETKPAANAEKSLAAGEAAAAAGSAIEVAAQMNTSVQIARQRVKKLQRAADQAGVEADLFGKTETNELKRVDSRFTELHELTVKRRDDRSDLDALLLNMDDLYRFLREFAESGNPDQQAWAGMQELLQGANSPARDLLRRARRLPNPVRAWITSLSDGGAQVFVGLAQKGLDERWRDEIVDYCQRAIEGRYPFAPGASLEVKLADFGRFFAPGGKLDTFFETHLKPLVDTTTSPWSWRSVSGTDFTGGQESLLQLERAGRIRAAFFPAGGSTPAVDLAITPTFLDSGSGKFMLVIDGQMLEYAHTAARPVKISWPSPEGAGYARLEFMDLVGQTTSLSASGDWAWFRLLDRARRRSRGDDTIQATFSKGGHTATVEIRANSVFNPLQLPDLTQFKCVPHL